jgi:hypothetical protein
MNKDDEEIGKQAAREPSKTSRLVAFVLVGLPFIFGLLGLLGVGQDQGLGDNRQLEESINAGYEKRDLEARGIAIFGILFVVLLGAIVVLVSVGMAVATGRPAPIQFPIQGLANAPQPTLPPEPRLETLPGVDYDQFHAAEERILNSYGWIDQKNRVVRIPIDRAIDIIVQQGLPSRPATGNQPQNQGQGFPSVPSSGRVTEPAP